MKSAWCPICMSMVEYEIRTDIEDCTFEGIKARYNRKNPFCSRCGTYLNIPDIIAENTNARLYAIWRAQKDESKKEADNG